MYHETKKIIGELRTHCRTSVTHLSESLQVPLATVYKHHKRIEQHFFKKYTALCTFSDLGYPLRFLFFCKLKSMESLSKDFLAHPAINSVFQLSNGFQLAIDAYFPTLAALESFKEELHELSLVVKPVPILSGKEELLLNKDSGTA